MKLRRLSFGLLLALLLALLLGSGPSPAAAEDAKFVIISHPDVPVTHLSARALNHIFTRQRLRWPDGKPIMPVELSHHSTRNAFFQKITSMTARETDSYWINQMMTNGKRPPKSFSLPILVIHYVSQTPGAIGFLQAGTAFDERVRRITLQ